MQIFWDSAADPDGS